MTSKQDLGIAAPWPTLDRHDYVSDDVFRRERERLFHGGWMLIGHADSVPTGGRRVIDLAGESVIVARDRRGEVHAFANVCRHRGAQLCAPHDPALDPSHCVVPSMQCPYHAWTYSLDGRLLSTPRVEPGEIDRDRHGLWTHRATEHNGLVFVTLSRDVEPLDAWLATHSPGLAGFDELRVGEMTVAARTAVDVAANWKIIVENYQECLHCAVVHPELVEVIPLYRTGSVIDPARDDGAVELDGNSLSADGYEDLPLVPGLGAEHAGVYRGGIVFPNAFLDVTGTSVVLTTLFPLAPDHTIAVSEYLFSPDVTIADRHAVDNVVRFNELVGSQDYVVCEGVQRGVASSAFEAGVLTSKDSLVHDFDQHYRSIIGLRRPME